MANNTVIQAPTIVPLTAAITVVSPYTGDDNSNNIARLRWRGTGDETWLPAFPMYAERSNKRFQGVIFGLSPSTVYELMLDYSDPDGADPPLTMVVRTKPDTSLIGTGPRYWVSTTGDDARDGSVIAPWRTFARAWQARVPGITIVFRGGVYPPIAASLAGASSIGSVNNPMTIQSQPGEEVIIDGQFAPVYGISIGAYGRILTNLVLRGLTVQNTDASNIRCDYTSYLTVEDCILKEARRGVSTSGLVSAHMEMRGQYLTFRRNRVVNTAAPYWSGSAWKTDVQGITLWQMTGGYHSVYNNLAEGGRYDDFVRTGGEKYAGQGWVQDSELYGNRILNPNDDGWQSEGGVARCVFWDNYVLNARKSGIGVGTVASGPAYVFRNRFLWTQPDINGEWGIGVKAGGGGNGKLYLVHNTWLGCLDWVANWTTGSFSNQEYYCNVAKVRRYLYEGLFAGNFSNYNCLFTPNSPIAKVDKSYIPYIQGPYEVDKYGVPQFPTLQAWQNATGLDVNSVWGDPKVDPLTGELQPGSPAVDRAYFFPAVSDWPRPVQGNGPDTGALESGETAQTYTLSVVVQGTGSVNPSSGQFYQGQAVQVVATAGPGWVFDHWEGDASGTNPVVSLTMDGNKSITAVFVQLPAVLIVNVTGNGSIYPSGSSNYPVGTEVTITATSFANNQFVEWQGTTETGNPITVTMDSSKTITAVFAPIKHFVTIGASVGGTTDPTPAIYEVNQGSSFTASALANGGYYFVEWQEDGAQVSIDLQYSFTVGTDDRAITAIFNLVPVEPTEYAVTISVIGSGTTDPAPGPYVVLKETGTFTVLAKPDSGFKLEKWEYGKDTSWQTSTANPLVINITDDTGIIATFVVAPPTPSSNVPLIAAVATLGLVLSLRRKA